MLKKAERRGSKVEGAASFWNLNTTVSRDFTSAHTCLRHPTFPHCKLTYYLASGTKAKVYYYFAFNVQRQQEQQILLIFHVI